MLGCLGREKTLLMLHKFYRTQILGPSIPILTDFVICKMKWSEAGSCFLRLIFTFEACHISGSQVCTCSSSVCKRLALLLQDSLASSQGILCSLMTWHENKKLFVEINQAAKLFLPSALLGFDTQALVLDHSAHLSTAWCPLWKKKHKVHRRSLDS